MPVSVKRRSLILQVIWMVLTFGMYSGYWYYITCRELSSVLKKEDNAFLWTLLFCVPPLCLYSYYKQGEVFEEVSGREMNRWIIFLLWIVFPPAVWLIIQNKLNAIADQQALSGPDGTAALT